MPKYKTGFPRIYTLTKYNVLTNTTYLSRSNSYLKRNYLLGPCRIHFHWCRSINKCADFAGISLHVFVFVLWRQHCRLGWQVLMTQHTSTQFHIILRQHSVEFWSRPRGRLALVDAFMNNNDIMTLEYPGTHALRHGLATEFEVARAVTRDDAK